MLPYLKERIRRQSATVPTVGIASILPTNHDIQSTFRHPTAASKSNAASNDTNTHCYMRNLVVRRPEIFSAKATFFQNPRTAVCFCSEHRPKTPRLSQTEKDLYQAWLAAS